MASIPPESFPPFKLKPRGHEANELHPAEITPQPLGKVPISELRGLPYWVLDGEWTIPTAAICQRGGIGIIERTKDGVYHGRYIWPAEKFGDPWQSKAPVAMFRLEYHDPNKEQPT